MCRYFFHIVDGRTNNVVKDPEGTFCSEVAQAKQEAIALARDIGVHKLHGLSWKVVVADENGNSVVTIPLSAVRGSVLRRWVAFFHRMATYEPRLRPRIFTYLLTFAIIVTIVQSAILTDTLPVARRNTNEVVMLNVRFASNANFGDINRFLLIRNATVVEGPRYDGSYRLRISTKALQNSQKTKFAEQITAEKIIAFAEAAH